MRSKGRVSAIHSQNCKSQSRKSKLRKPSSKELDLFVLAGCSCLLTLLHHPVAEALQSHATSGTRAAIATQTSTTTNSMNAFHLVVPPAKEKDEDGRRKAEG